MGIFISMVNNFSGIFHMKYLMLPHVSNACRNEVSIEQYHSYYTVTMVQGIQGIQLVL